jgi:hypothetical protein
MKYILVLLPIFLFGLLSAIQYWGQIYFNANLESLTIVHPVENGINYEYKTTIFNHLDNLFAILLFAIPLVCSLYYTFKSIPSKKWNPLKFTVLGWIVVIALETILTPDYQVLVPVVGAMILSIYFAAHAILVFGEILYKKHKTK